MQNGTNTVDESLIPPERFRTGLGSLSDLNSMSHSPHLGLLQGWDVRIGVFPEREVFVGSERPNGPQAKRTVRADMGLCEPRPEASHDPLQ